jgi:hypothetical protein
MSGLSRHLTKIKMSHKEYYDKFFKKENEGICVFCGKESKFIRITTGYHRLCGAKECTSKALATSSLETIRITKGLSVEDSKKILKNKTDKHKKSWKNTVDERSSLDPDYIKKMTGYTKESYIARGFSEEEAIIKSKISAKKSATSLKNRYLIPENKEKLKKSRWTNNQYWISKGYSLENSIIEISKRQSRNLEFFQNKYGLELGKTKWLDKIKSWSNACQRRAWSMASQDMFWFLYDVILTDSEKKHINFATYDINNPMKPEYNKFHNNFEKRLILGDRIILPDFILKDKIIEFDGIYWHNKSMIKSGNFNREKIRDEIIKTHNYKVLHVSEDDWYKNPDSVIEKCVEFLRS